MIPSARHAAIALLAGLLAACSAEQDAKDARIRAYVHDTTADLRPPGRLQVTVPEGIVSDGRIAKIRGTVQNRYDEPVHGIRYMVLMVEAGDDARVLDSWQREVDTELDPGERRMLRLEAESMYFGRSGGRYVVVAEPVRVGDKDMPPPPGWR